MNTKITEVQRKQIEAKIRELNNSKRTGLYITLAIILVGSLITIIGCLSSGGHTAMFIPFGIILSFIVGMMPYSIIAYKVKKTYKLSVLPLVLKAILGEDSTYIYNGGYNIALLKELAFFPITTYKKEDLISGTYKDVKFICADILMQHQQSSGKSTTTVTDFKGTMWVFTFNKRINSRIDIAEKGYVYRRKKGMEKIEFEDIVFNEQFKSYSNNGHDAFYIITPQMIEAIKKNLEGIKGNILYSFQGDKLYLVISSNEQRFEFTKDINSVPDLIRKVNNDLSPIFETIDVFRLEEKLYS